MRCPTCTSNRIVVIVSPDARAFCVRCGARWRGDVAKKPLRPASTSSPWMRVAATSGDPDPA